MSFGGFLTCAILIAASLITAVVPVVVGRVRLKRALRPVEYYPPRGYSPIDVLIKYYGKAADPHLLFNALMLYWADKGYITIEEDCKRGLKLTRLKQLAPTEAPPPKRRRGRQQKAAAPAVTAVNESPCFELEKAVFNEIFCFGNVFYTLAAPISHKQSYDKIMDDCKKAASGQTRATQKAEIGTCLLSVAVMIIVTLVCGLTVRDPVFMAMIFPIVGVPFFRTIPNDGIGGIIKYPFLAVWGGAPFALVLSLTPPDCAVLLGCAVGSSFIVVHILSRFIDLRSEQDLEIYGRICAFKTFLIEAELDVLETLIEDDPDYFYNILPYCYILKITDKLRAKFDRIALDGPSWYLGEMRDTLMF